MNTYNDHNSILHPGREFIIVRSRVVLIYLAAVQRSGGHTTARPRSAGWQPAAAGVMAAARTIQANNAWCQLYYKYNIWRRALLGWGHVCQSVFI